MIDATQRVEESSAWLDRGRQRLQGICTRTTLHTVARLAVTLILPRLGWIAMCMRGLLRGSRLASTVTSTKFDTVQVDRVPGIRFNE